MLHLGDRRYPVLFPFLTVLGFTVALEFFVNVILRDPSALGAYAIFPYIALIIYFAFRAGIRGGLIAAVITVAFYFYIIYFHFMSPFSNKAFTFGETFSF